mmetsp:Transcript_29324/g.76010  ORF Transcript_29324/g.76010 Transcript_29324/m.76010 type:complete len:97 (-) Transcript_29324:2653-2943(-)
MVAAMDIVTAMDMVTARDMGAAMDTVALIDMVAARNKGAALKEQAVRVAVGAATVAGQASLLPCMTGLGRVVPANMQGQHLGLSMVCTRHLIRGGC